MILLCDTNIFLQANIPSHLMLMRLFQETRKFFVGLDAMQAIEQEYFFYGTRSQYLQNIIQRLQTERLQRAADGLTGNLDISKEGRLNDFVKRNPSISSFETTMLTVALANPGVTLVCVDPQCETLPAKRQLLLPPKISDLKSAFPEIEIKNCKEVIEDLRALPEGVPRDITSLELFLASKGNREHDYLEFKQPQNGLVTRMCHDIAKAACAMLNTTTGFVMIGVDENANAQIKGFVKEYNGQPRSHDQIENLLTNNFLLEINPRPDSYIHVWSIDILSSSKIVMIVFVEKGSTTYQFNFMQHGWKIYRRLGTQSLSSV